MDSDWFSFGHAHGWLLYLGDLMLQMLGKRNDSLSEMVKMGASALVFDCGIT